MLLQSHLNKQKNSWPVAIKGDFENAIHNTKSKNDLAILLA